MALLYGIFIGMAQDFLPAGSVLNDMIRPHAVMLGKRLGGRQWLMELVSVLGRASGCVRSVLSCMVGRRFAVWGRAAIMVLAVRVDRCRRRGWCRRRGGCGRRNSCATGYALGGGRSSRLRFHGRIFGSSRRFD